MGAAVAALFDFRRQGPPSRPFFTPATKVRNALTLRNIAPEALA